MKILTSCLILFLFVLTVIPRALHGQFTDSYASAEAESYVETLRKQLDWPKSNDSFTTDADYLAQTFSRTDRLNISPEIVLNHIRLAQDVRNKYYSYIPPKAYQDYLLALRVRYERTAHANWRQVLYEKLNPLTKSSTDIDQVAAIVFQWIRENVQLENEGDTYPVGFKGDLDPLTTLKGKAGTEIDMAILGVAALRSVGIASRIVMAPAIANEKGGKVWLEYRSKNDWIPWVPSNISNSNHLEWLQKEFGKNLSVIVTNPNTPTNITPRYLQTSPIWFCPDPLTTDFSVNLSVMGNKCLMPILGKDLMNIIPNNLDYGINPQVYLIAFGKRTNVFGYKLISNILNQKTWYTFSFKERKQYFEVSNVKPEFFPWTETHSVIFQEKW